jgi:hypothetical protein
VKKANLKLVQDSGEGDKSASAEVEGDKAPSRFMWQQVKLFGLQGAAYLNGRIGTCTELDEATGRLVSGPSMPPLDPPPDPLCTPS